MAGEDGGVLPAPSIFFRPATLDDLDRVVELEAEGYAPDEAADRDKMTLRLTKAARYFLVAVESSSAPLPSSSPAPDRVVGFVCATRCPGPRLTEASMSLHDPSGELLAVHSVCVDRALRRRGLATRMLAAYVQAVALPAAADGVASARLIARPHLIGLYERAGFVLVGESDVVHGTSKWFDMRLDIVP